MRNYLSPGQDRDDLHTSDYYDPSQPILNENLVAHAEYGYEDDPSRLSSNHSKTSNAQDDHPISLQEYLSIFDEFKLAAEGHAQNLQSSVLSIKHKTDNIMSELDHTQGILHKAAVTRDAISTSPMPSKEMASSTKYSQTRYNPLRGRDNTFDTRLEKYKQNAEDRKSNNRSASRVSDKHIKDQLRSINKLKSTFEQREEEFERLKSIIEDNENDKFAFIYQTESFMQMISQQFNTESYADKSNSGSYYGNNDPRFYRNDESPEPINSYESIKMQDLQRTNELLLKELRKANDK